MDDAAPSPPSDRIVAIIPIGTLENAKSRLGGTLDAEERRDLVDTMIYRTVRAALATPGIAETLVVSPDRDALEQATFLGARTMRQKGQGLNAGLREARDDAIAGGAGAVAIIPIDLPLVSPDALRQLIAPLGVVGERPLVVLAPDRHRRGTNGLVVAPPDAIELAFGGDSRAAHEACARDAGARYVELDGPLGLDLDTPDDLLLVEALADDAADVLETADAG
ncbi:MAG TPA: 2-phospho-L-lactate guanylyltransferase [Candidatus Limnocylindrales bacterium]|nr:2-phospho-L-lactate guanylyltransferase [Candidatus Limnocylindrales bacterium]